MRKTLFFLAIALLTLPACEQFQAGGGQPVEFKKIPVTYPVTYQDTSVVDTYFGKEVVDPYRWLEDEGSEGVENWIRAQNDMTFSYLEQIPYRDAFQERLTEVWNYERYQAPFKSGGQYYFFKNDGLQNQDVLFTQNTLEAEPEVLLNPNELSEDGTVALGEIAFSQDGSLLAVQLSQGGSDWRTIRVLDVATKRFLEDEVRWVKFSDISWAGDGFFYSRYPQPQDTTLSDVNQFHQVYYHRVGTNQEEDELVFADRSFPQRNFYTSTTEDERFLILNVVESTSGNALYFRDLQAENIAFTPVVETFEHDFEVIGSVGNDLFVLTNFQAPKQRLLRINTRQPEQGFWEEIIPEGEDVLETAQLIGGRIVTTYLHDASHQLKIFTLTGAEVGELPLPGLGTITAIEGQFDDPEAFFEYTSFTQPTTIYRLDMDALNYTKFREPELDFTPSDYTTEQVWFESYDGTRVPMFLTYKKDLPKDGMNPTLLYGYGGFNISVMPRFSTSKIPLLENGGIYAVANIRGGGEFGSEWHEAGTKAQKQNVFNDFQAAAEYLLANRYTSSPKLAIEGRSNGGLLVGACMTQRPDLYQVAFPGVGVLDMLRYHKFTIGWAWASDYGTSETKEGFDYLISYSPLHNVEPANYPATLVTTADHDDRVVPAHSFKFTSALQANQTGTNPVLIRIETSAGHGAGTPVNKRINEAVDMLSFMFYNMRENVIYDF